MSQKNVEIVRSALEAFNARDKVKWDEVLASDVEVQPPPEWPENAVVRGPDDAWHFFIGNEGVWEGTEYTLTETIASGLKVFACAERLVAGKGSGVQVGELRFFGVFDVVNGTVEKAEFFLTGFGVAAARIELGGEFVAETPCVVEILIHLDATLHALPTEMNLGERRRASDAGVRSCSWLMTSRRATTCCSSTREREPTNKARRRAPSGSFSRNPTVARCCAERPRKWGRSAVHAKPSTARSRARRRGRTPPETGLHVPLIRKGDSAPPLVTFCQGLRASSLHRA